jgi:hypothetical protein
MNYDKLVPLTKEQVAILEKNGCRSGDWTQIMVFTGFDPSRVINTRFEEEIKIGDLNGAFTLANGRKCHAGIYNANLINVIIGDNCLISNINGRLMNLEIDDNVWIENVGTVACTSTSEFGNGYEICPLNENGGREIKMTEITSAQTAYLNVMYRHEKEFIESLDQIAENHAKSRSNNRSHIGKEACIANTQTIENVNIGPCAIIDGAATLQNGTIVSSKDAPTVVGNNVVARNFIFQKGSSIKDGAMIYDSLIGEATSVGKQFSAENSLFFSNSECFHSEACSVFAGPYSVTHHRSTLLIAGYFSFYNAGSGTNQSNHMYKLGPLHQGILERGCKTGSSSYLLWPSHIGAFTPIIGKHYRNFDTSDFPFSYISEDNGKSVLVPGMNFFTIGTVRDGKKWPARDKRKNSDKLDLIIFDVLSPYTGQKMIKSRKILTELYEKAMKESYEKSDTKPEYYTYKGAHIKRLLLKTCNRYYELILKKYFGDILIKRIEKEFPGKLREILKRDSHGTEGTADWLDICGLLCDSSRIEKLVRAVGIKKIDSLEKIQEELLKIKSSYQADEWNWFLAQYKTIHKADFSSEDDDVLKKFIEEWKKASIKLINLVLNDAEKEFDENTRIGFGIDGARDADFAAVRGTYQNDEFVKHLQGELASIENKYEETIKLI